LSVARATGAGRNTSRSVRVSVRPATSATETAAANTSRNASSFTDTHASDAMPNDVHLRRSPAWIIQGTNHAYNTSG
jgi:hypothetical protein